MKLFKRKFVSCNILPLISEKMALFGFKRNRCNFKDLYILFSILKLLKNEWNFFLYFLKPTSRKVKFFLKPTDENSTFLLLAQHMQDFLRNNIKDTNLIVVVLTGLCRFKRLLWLMTVMRIDANPIYPECAKAEDISFQLLTQSRKTEQRHLWHTKWM